MGKIFSICVLLISIKIIYGQKGVRIISNDIDGNINDGITPDPLLEIVYKECGGDVELSFGPDIYIEYKLGQSLELNERCIWIFKSDLQNYYSVKVTLISQGFGPRTGIAMYTVDSDRSNLSSYIIGMGSEYEILLHPFTFLSFFADSLGSGFRANFQLILREENHVIPLPKATIASLSTWHDFYRHPINTSALYEQNERVYVIINPPNPNREYMRLNVDFMDIQKCGATCTCDRLDVYRIFGTNGYTSDARLCGIVPQGTTAIVSSRSSNPIIFIFHSQKNSTTAGGFQVTWEQQSNP